MTIEVTIIEARWDGPYSWPGFESHNDLRPIPSTSGVYLQTFDYQGGYLIFCAGLTRRPVSKRLREHTHNFMNGKYNVLDIAAAQQGIRLEIWHGWGYAREHQEEFKEQKKIIRDAVGKLLAGFRIFVADLGNQPRILERLEAAIMMHLYQQPAPFCDIPDRGLHLAPRWKSESPIIIKNTCADVLHGLSARLEI